MKSFKSFTEEGDPTSTADVVGTGDDVADWKTKKKKKKSSVVTRHYIEVNGKRKKQMKESLQEAYPRAQLLDNIKDDILSVLDDIDPSYLKPEMLKDPKEINKEIEGYYEYNMGSGPGYKVKDVAGVLKKHHKEFLKFIKNKKQSK